MSESYQSNQCDRLVTVVALCFNQSSFLKETLDSIMAQTWFPGHFFIIDDCSTDDSVEKIKEWLADNNNPATLIRHQENQGITRSMNHALSLCKTKYFQPWPCDDLMMPDKIESQVNFLESLNWEPGFLYGDIQWIDNNGVLLRESVIADRKKFFPNCEMPSGFIFPQLVTFGCFIPTASGIYVTKALNELGGFNEKLFAEDWDMFMRISLKYGIAFKNQVFSKYRRHNASAEMNRGAKYWQGHFKILPRFLGISDEYDDIIYKKLSNDAIEAYKNGYSGALKIIRKQAYRQFSLKLFAIYLKLVFVSIFK